MRHMRNGINVMVYIFCVCIVIAISCEFQVTNRKMKKYEKEFLLKKEQEAQLEDPVERLQVVCRHQEFQCAFMHMPYIPKYRCTCVCVALWSPFQP